MKHKKSNIPHAKFNRTTFLYISILLIGAFLRFFRLDENIYFSGEIGHNLLTIKDAYSNGTLPLIGPPTSHSWLYFGPLFYWLYGPILIFSRFNPVSHAYFGAVIAWSILPVHYFVIKKLFSIRIALLSTFLIAISPLFLEFAHFARFFSFVPLLVYPFIYCLYRATRGDKHFIFWLTFVYGCMFSFHFTPLMLFPLAVSLFIIKRVKLQLKDSAFALLGFLLPMLPFLIYDIQHSMQMTTKIALWIPYRIAGFFGLISKNTVSAEVIHENTSSIIAFFEKSFVPSGFLPLLIVLVLALGLYTLLNNEKFAKKKVSDIFLLLLLWLGWGCLSVFIHGSPPIHYFLPMLPLPIIFVSLYLDYLWNKSVGRYIVIAFLGGIIFVTGGYYFSDKWFYVSQTRGDWSRQDVPYELQKRVIKVIIDDVQGEDFMLKRVGINDQFEGDYAQNYTYLLWLQGNEPVKEADLTYIIVEQPERIGKEYAGAVKFLRVENILIIKIPTDLLPPDERLTIL